MSGRPSSCSCVRSGRAVTASGNAITRTKEQPLRVNGARLTEPVFARPGLSGPRARSYGAGGADTRLTTGQSGKDQVGRTSLRPSAPVKKKINALDPTLRGEKIYKAFTPSPLNFRRQPAASTGISPRLSTNLVPRRTASPRVTPFGGGNVIFSRRIELRSCTVFVQ
jgi:hypothetical protein